MWFTPPREVASKVWTRLPDRFRNPQRNGWVDANFGAGRLVEAVLEGPCFDRDGNLYVTDIPCGRIFRIGGEGDWALVVQYDGLPNGLKVTSDQKLLVADFRLGLISIDPGSGMVLPRLETIYSEGFKGLNDLTLHPDGSVIFTDQGQTGLHDPSGRVWRLHEDGRLTLLLSNGPSPNGLVLTPTASHLYVAMTRSSQIWMFALRPDGTVTKAQNFCQLPGGRSGPDGLAVDRFGRLFVCDPAHGCVWVIDEHGIPRLRILSAAESAVTNCAFADDGRTLFMTEAGSASVLVYEVPAP